nr:NAD-dependent epimerase/dehydratase family protein [uncultured Moraxella sp.]
MQRTAVIIGATGLVGRSLLLQLTSLYKKVIIIARSQPKGMSENMHFYQLKDFNQLDSLLTTLNLDNQVDAFSCLGSTLKQAGSEEAFYQIDFEFNYAFAKTCREKNVERFFLLSAMGADKDSRFFYNRVKGELEDAVITLGFQRLAIFRPSFLLGKHDNRKLENLAQTAFGIIKPIIPKKLSVRPIEAERVAMAMALTANQWYIANTYHVSQVQRKKDNSPQTKVVSNADMLTMTSFNS